MSMAPPSLLRFKCVIMLISRLHVASAVFGHAHDLVPSLPQVDLGRFWAELAHIAWAPVLTQSPAVGLPWPQANMAEQLAPPRAVRPRSEMWLVSSALRLLDGECRRAYHIIDPCKSC